MGTGFLVMGTWYWVLGRRTWVIGTRTKVMGTGSWVMGHGYWVLGHGLLDKGRAFWVLRTWARKFNSARRQLGEVGTDSTRPVGMCCITAWRVQRSNFHSFSGNSANTELINLLLESGIIGSP